MGILVLGILLVVVLGGILLLFRGLSLPTFGHVNLSCPHCGQDTPSQKPTCAHCQAELR